MFKLCKSILIMLAVVLLISCDSGNAKIQTKQLIIPKADFYEYVYIQGLDDDGMASTNTQKTYSDKVLVKDVLKIVDRVVVKKPKYEKDIQSVKQLHDKGSYILAFGDTGDFRGRSYTIYLLKDGTLYYQDILGGKDISFVSVDKHPDKVKEILDLLKIDF
ncbi:hypothetical protein [Kurthia sibirica]|uniref:Lipoprotein n=1 Tax=Kurthia sibirica TaxID=202750 RepID=A0A2U3AM18_9BACL|nr:hypothetical protein [Kurthia sibirica]PWI25560.1 hypothetical protein DEX24_08110 [Kurthia sibirica]GEK33939.1 hypothetical protein KSI01_14720 [Kurthia sibirica]